MYYIFNNGNVCVGTCNIEPDQEDLNTRGEFCILSDSTHQIGSLYTGGVIEDISIKTDYNVLGRKLRDYIRESIDVFLQPASTISDKLVTDEQKSILIQDSLALAKWPAQEGWPYIDLPILSDLCKSLLTITDWEYPTQKVS
jgi:hypothetical protein